MVEIGKSLRNLRQARGLSLQEVSQATGLSVAFLSKVERDLSNITMGHLRRLANFYGVQLVSLFEDREELENPVIRKGQGVKINAQGVELQLLMGKDNGVLEPIVAIHHPKSQSGALYTHHGEEFNYILEGQLLYILGGDEYLLEEGDSISHSSSVPHGWINPGKTKAVVLTVVTPPSFLF
ncbi:MAG: XRE family transcriptional regulator [Bacillota bacterium]